MSRTSPKNQISVLGRRHTTKFAAAGSLAIVRLLWKGHTGEALPQPLAVAAGQRRPIASLVFADRAGAVRAGAVLAPTVRGPTPRCFAHCLVVVCLAPGGVAVATVRVRVAVHRDRVAPHLDVPGVGVARVEPDGDVGLLAVHVVVDDGHV